MAVGRGDGTGWGELSAWHLFSPVRQTWYVLWWLSAFSVKQGMQDLALRAGTPSPLLCPKPAPSPGWEMDASALDGMCHSAKVMGIGRAAVGAIFVIH